MIFSGVRAVPSLFLCVVLCRWFVVLYVIRLTFNNYSFDIFKLFKVALNTIKQTKENKNPFKTIGSKDEHRTVNVKTLITKWTTRTHLKIRMISIFWNLRQPLSNQYFVHVQNHYPDSHRQITWSLLCSMIWGEMQLCRFAYIGGIVPNNCVHVL